MLSSFRYDMQHLKGFPLERTVALALAEAIDSPRALTVYMLLKYKQYEQLADLEIRPLDYDEPSHFAEDYLITKVLSKSSFMPLKVDRAAKALASFHEAEELCRQTNTRLIEDRDNGTHPEWYSRFIENVYHVLGPLEREDLEFIESNFRHGPGATTAVPGIGMVISDKYDAQMHLTAPLVPFYRTLLGDRWWEIQAHPLVVPGNKFTSVPKNAKTDRGICVEPTLNVFGQLGIGKCIREKLRRTGVNLNSQLVNQKMAELAFDCGYATIDLSKASDTMSYVLVLDALPPAWFKLVDDFRSPKTCLPNKEFVELEKFSSMGNGYTFELETLMFLAAARTCVPRSKWDHISVYGDDIIVPQEHAHELIEVLRYLGFNTNQSKSFLAGNFFESCGTDWFQGKNVRPFFLKKSKGTPIPYTLQIANALRLWSSRKCGHQCCDALFKPLWDSLVRAVPKPWSKTFVPAHLGDAGILRSFDEAKPARARDGLELHVARHVSMRPVKVRKDTPGTLIHALTGTYSGDSGPKGPLLSAESPFPPDFESVRDWIGVEPHIRTLGYEPKRGLYGRVRVKNVQVSTWTDGLDWH